MNVLKKTMPTIIQDIYEELTHELRTLKTYKDIDQVINYNLLKLSHCLSYDVFKIKNDMDYLDQVEVIKQYRQSVTISQNVDFFRSIIQKFQRVKIMTMVVVYEKNPEFIYES